MRIHDLKPAPGSVKKRKRVGRGHGSGHGGTSGRGHKGQLARSGGGKGPGFEGGQNPLQRRLPKLPGFKNRFSKEFSVVNISRLEHFNDGSVVDAELMESAGLIKKVGIPVKILGDGGLKKKLTVKAASFTESARQKIESAGGKVEEIKKEQTAGGRKPEASKKPKKPEPKASDSGQKAEVSKKPKKPEPKAEAD